MEQRIDHDALDTALKRCGASWDAAQTHGLLSGRLAIAGGDSGFSWLAQVLEGAEDAYGLKADCETLLVALFESTLRQLSARMSEFEPLLPDDENTAAERAAALGRWCEGFLHGLVSTDYADALQARLAADPLSGVINDMLQITRAFAEDDADDESNDEAYSELVEYLRVATQLTYEELAEFRHHAGEGGATQSSDALH